LLPLKPSARIFDTFGARFLNILNVLEDTLDIFHAVLDDHLVRLTQNNHLSQRPLELLELRGHFIHRERQFHLQGHNLRLAEPFQTLRIRQAGHQGRREFLFQGN
jgi:hypothetical protein